MKLTLRNKLNRPLTWVEVDNNFRYLNAGLWVNLITIIGVILYLLGGK